MSRALAVALSLVALAGCGRTPIDVWSTFLPPPETTDERNPCQDVDFLFVIDDSASMETYQTKLAANYGVFVEGVYRALSDLESVHVGVTTTDGYAFNVDECRSLGDLVVRTGGQNSSGRACGPFEDGEHFMTDADDLESAFACTARVGTQGSTHERPFAAMIAALEAGRSDEGCNAGFIRDDALLVTVIVSDEDDLGDPQAAYQAVVDLKPAGPLDVVAVTIANPLDGECRLRGHAKPGKHLLAFTEAFDYGFFAPICASDYGRVFDDAVEAVRQACRPE